MKHPSQETRFSQETRYSEKLSLTQTILETLGQTGFRPAFIEPAAGRARARRVSGGLAVLLALVAAGVVLLRTWPSEPRPVAGSPVAVLELVRGSVGMLAASTGQDPSELLALDAGTAIHAGAVIETGPSQAGSRQTGTASGRAAFRLAGGESMRLDTDTRVRVTSSSAVELERGAVYFDSAGGASGVEVRTTLGLVRDIGTQFEVRLMDAGEREALRVRVREGEVVLERTGDSHQAGAGVELSLGSDGTLTRGTSPTHGAAWDWVLETAPAPDIAGRPLAVFLEWVTREGGWTVRFADAETAELAATTTLHGDVLNLNLAEASSMVFQGSRLDYRVEGETFFVAPAEVPEAGR